MTLANKTNNPSTGAQGGPDVFQRGQSIDSPAFDTQDSSDQGQAQQVDIDEVFSSADIEYTGEQREAFTQGYQVGMALAHSDSAKISFVEMADIEHTAIPEKNTESSINIELPSDPNDSSATSTYSKGEPDLSTMSNHMDQGTSNTTPSPADVKSFARFVAISAAALIVSGIWGWTRGIIPAPIAIGGSILLVVLLVFTTNLQIFLNIE